MPKYIYILIIGMFLVFASAVSAQDITFHYQYSFEPAMFDHPPELGGLEVSFPDAARKGGAEGTAKLDFTLGEDGKVHDIVIVQDLPFGVGDAAKNGLEKLSFSPAQLAGKPVAIKGHLSYIVTMVYDENDKNVTKPQIALKPEPEYPPSGRADKVSGKVLVSVLFNADGSLKVLGTNSTMPKEFDKAAAEAAAKIKFSPAIHKKSKNPVSQQITVTYDFKP